VVAVPAAPDDVLAELAPPAPELVLADVVLEFVEPADGLGLSAVEHMLPVAMIAPPMINVVSGLEKRLIFFSEPPASTRPEKDSCMGVTKNLPAARKERWRRSPSSRRLEFQATEAPGDRNPMIKLEFPAIDRRPDETFTCGGYH